MNESKFLFPGTTWNDPVNKLTKFARSSSIHDKHKLHRIKCLDQINTTSV